MPHYSRTISKTICRGGKVRERLEGLSCRRPGSVGAAISETTAAGYTKETRLLLQKQRPERGYGRLLALRQIQARVRCEGKYTRARGKSYLASSLEHEKQPCTDDTVSITVSDECCTTNKERCLNMDMPLPRPPSKDPIH